MGALWVILVVGSHRWGHSRESSEDRHLYPDDPDSTNYGDMG